MDTYEVALRQMQVSAPSLYALTVGVPEKCVRPGVMYWYGQYLARRASRTTEKVNEATAL